MKEHKSNNPKTIRTKNKMTEEKEEENPQAGKQANLEQNEDLSREQIGPEGKADEKVPLESDDLGQEDLIPELTLEEENAYDSEEIEKAKVRVTDRLEETRERLEDDLGGKPADDMKSFREHRESLSSVVRELADLIRRQDRNDPAVSELEQMSVRLGENRFLVGAFGTTFAGKSTLVNALVGGKTDLLKEGGGRTTLVVTRIMKPYGDYSEGASILEYKSMEELDKMMLINLSRLSIRLEEVPKNRNFADPKFRTWLHGIVQDVKPEESEEASERTSIAESEASNFLRDLLAGWDDCESFIGEKRTFSPEEREESDSFVNRPNFKHASYVAQRILFHENRLTGEHEIELIDAPGVSADASDTKRALSIARKADAFVFVSSHGFNFMQADREFLGDLEDWLQGERMRKLIFVFNKTQSIDLDACDPPAKNWEEAIQLETDRFKVTLAKHGFTDVHVLSVDARCGKLARRLKVTPEDQREDSLEDRFMRSRFPGVEEIDENLKLSGLEGFERNLVDIILNLKYHHDVSEQVRKIEKIEADYRSNLRKTIDGYGKKIEEIKQELVDHKKERKRAKMTLNGYQQTYKCRASKVYRDAGDKSDQMINAYFDKVVSQVMWLVWSLNKEKGGSVNTNTLIKRAINENIPSLASDVKNTRKEYEAKYRQIRDREFKDEYNELLQDYGADSEMEIVLEDRDDEERESISGYAQCLELNFGELLFANIWGGFLDIVKGNIFSGKQEEFAREVKRILNDKRGGFRHTMINVLTDWMERDWVHFESQSTEQFEVFMNQIEKRIKNRMNARRRWKGKEKKREQGLEKFHEASGEIIDKLKEVRREAEKRRPFEGGDA